MESVMERASAREQPDSANAAPPAAADETETTGASSAQQPDEKQKQSGGAEGASSETAVAPAEPIGTSARSATDDAAHS